MRTNINPSIKDFHSRNLRVYSKALRALLKTSTQAAPQAEGLQRPRVFNGRDVHLQLVVAKP